MKDTSYQPTDRRPVASRQLTSVGRFAAWLVSRGISANSISLASTVFSMLACLSLMGTTWGDGALPRVLFFCGAVFIQARLLANLFDGMVALDSGTSSPLGEVLNEVPDRVSDPLILIGAGFAVGGWPSLGFIAAILAVFVAYVRVLGNSLGERDLFLGPMAKPQRMATLTVACIYSGCVPASWPGGIESAPGFGATTFALVLVVVGSVVTAVRRLRRISVQLRRRG